MFLGFSGVLLHVSGDFEGVLKGLAPDLGSSRPKVGRMELHPAGAP